jgi:hypothetical protein
MDIVVDCVSSSSTIRGVKKEQEEIVVTKEEDEEVEDEDEEDPVKNCSKARSSNCKTNDNNDHLDEDEDEDEVDDYADWTKGNWCWLLPATNNNGITTHSADVKLEGRSKNDKTTIPSVSRSMKRAPKRRRDSHGKQQHDKNNNVSFEKELLSDNNNDNNNEDEDELPKKKKKRNLKCCRSQQQYNNSSSIHPNNLPSSSNSSIQDNETIVDDNDNDNDHENEIENENENENVDDTIIKQEEGAKAKEEEEDNSDSKINAADNDNNDTDADDYDYGYESWTEGNWCLLLPSTSAADDDEKQDDEPSSEDVSAIENGTSQRRLRSSSRHCIYNLSSVSLGVGGDDTYENEYDDEDCVDNDDNIIDQQTRTKITGKHKYQWYGMFRRLVAYQKKYGSTNVTKRYKEDPKLGIWVCTQRSSYNKKELSEERINRLDSIGFVWKLGVQQIPWDDMYQKLVAYKKKHRSTNVHRNSPADPRLGNWVHHQRTFYKTKTISIDRINQLESIGFACDLLGQKWMEFFHKLVAYKKQNKSASVPRSYKEDPKLGVWVSHQRAFYKNNTISIERINLLESIDFVWDPLDAQWIRMYSKLVAYKNIHDTTLVPLSYKKDPQLAKWTYVQRCMKNKLTDKRTELLNSINFVW